MEPIYICEYTVDDQMVDRFGRMKPSTILYLAQEMGGRHSALMELDYDALASRRLFWAVTRHRVQVTKIPMLGQKLRVETWPLPATRVAYPRSVVAYDEEGNECFRAMTLWVLMDMDTRNMILPGKSGISVAGTLRGNELPAPGGLIPRPIGNMTHRRVCFSDLDRNGHMNNTRCMDWIADMLPSSFHGERSVKEFVVCYLREAREGENLCVNWELSEENVLQADARCGEGDGEYRVFSTRIFYDM